MKEFGKRLLLNRVLLLIGVVAFFLVVGPRALNPLNIFGIGEDARQLAFGLKTLTVN